MQIDLVTIAFAYIAVGVASSLRLLVVLILSMNGMMYKGDSEVSKKIAEVKDGLRHPALELMPIASSFLISVGVILIMAYSAMIWPVSLFKLIKRIVTK